jgi:hypothetical protein
MVHSARIFRVSNTTKELDAMHLENARAAIAESLRMLKDVSPLDTFVGRKTQEPFRTEQPD